MHLVILFFIAFVASVFADAPPLLVESSLSSLVLEGPDLHPSLKTARLEDKAFLHVHRHVLKGNPQLSSDSEFVEVIARGGSQGRLGGKGIRSALYALYQANHEVGLYGLEAASTVDADRLEDAIRSIWSHNARMNLARVHRRGMVILVVWTNGIPREMWDDLNGRLENRLSTRQ